MASGENPIFSELSDKAKSIAHQDLIKLELAENSDIADELCQSIAERAEGDPEAAKVLNSLQGKTSALAFLANAFSLSPYLRDCALLNPAAFVSLLGKPFPAEVNEIIDQTADQWRQAQDQTELMGQLRIAKRRIALALGLADLGGWMSAQEVTHSLSRFADASLGAAVNFLLLELHKNNKIALPDPDHPSADSGLIVLGMGKYGAFELNYSSDIDIILFFDDACPALSACDDPTSLFVRLAKQLNRLLQERTGEGYVFRVDLRLRPDPGSTPLAISIEAALNYYAGYGQNWERAAFIKARAVAGDIAAGQGFLKELAPFVWRKYLDFAAIQDVHSIKRQIHAHKGHGKIAVKGHNIKLGRGGIREIEFFVQTQQLIAGGRHDALRVDSTMAGLGALEKGGWINASTREELVEAYWFLRNVEHRIQMIADEQSHMLPDDDLGLLRIAVMMGFNDGAAFSNALIAQMETVETIYAQLFEAAPELTGQGGNLVFTGDDEDPETVETLHRLGFKQPSQVISSIKAWHYGRYPAVRSSQAREMLTELTPQFLESFSRTANPDQSFFGFDRFLQGLPAGIQFFGILKANPRLSDLLSLILDAAPRLADIITRKPHVFDALIDPTFGADIPTRQELEERLQTVLSRAESYEEILDGARIFAAEQRFLIGIRLINRTIAPKRAGEAFTLLAETLISAMLEAVKSDFQQRHGKIEGGEIAILGMGRLGSRNLTAGSDLDLIFLYRHSEDADYSDGDKPLHTQQYYTRLVQRLITAMNAPTAEGRIFELDFRLRPSGNSGPLATQYNSFLKYQANEAWVWEKQALVRARPVAGDENFVRDLAAELDTLLNNKGDVRKVSRAICKMRERLDEEKPPANAFDVKRTKGGLIDIEFISQWLVLTGGIENRAGVLPTGTLSLLAMARPDRLVSEEIEVLTTAYGLYNGVLQIDRICLEDKFEPGKTSAGFAALLCEQTGHPSLSALEQDLIISGEAVREIFNRHIR